MSDTPLDPPGEPDPRETRRDDRRRSPREDGGGDRRGGDGDGPSHPRYENRGVLGVGGQGIVHRVYDRELRRDVALKTLFADKVSVDAAERFVREATATAGLEHPNIVPIYDVGRLDDGRPFYTMRLVPGRSLKDVLVLLEAGTQAEWTLVRLVQVVQQACLALQFAHDRGIVHRDVKPGNILLGDHGEVLVVDWGIAKGLPGAGTTTTGVMQGTIHYMSPEQACGDRVDARSDVYALGVVLYQCLAQRLPHDAASGGELIAAILRDAPAPIESVASRPVPPELSALVARAMAKRREERLQSAKELHDGLQAYLEGARDLAKKLESAERLQRQGEESLRRHAETTATLAALATRIESLEKEHPPWEPIAQKRELLEAQGLLEDLEDRARAEFLEAVRHLTDSLAHVPGHAPARGALADLFWERFREAETRMDRPLAQVYRMLVERFHDGRFARELEGKGSLRLTVSPKSADLILYRLVERDLVMVEGEGRFLGRGDAWVPELEMGSYVVVARADGHETARYPVAIFRNTDWEGELRLLPAGSIPAGFVHVPGTWAWLGGDPKAASSRPLRRVWVDSFLMQVYPVTFGQWCEFLDALPAEEADARVPRTESLGPICERVDGRFQPAGLQRVIAPWTRETHGPDCAVRVPVMGVRREDIDAYCDWMRSARGLDVRLPTAEEWELAARGVDRRAFPWGNRFDVAACHNRASTPRTPDVAPVGACPTDASIYGVRDLAGGMLDLTSSWLDEAQKLYEVRGGSWHLGPEACRAARRDVATPKTRTAHVGFRVVVGGA